jgi:hypothetical protein
MKVDRKLYDVSAEKRNKNMETKTKICGKKENSFDESGNEMERHFPTEQMRKQKFPFSINTKFLFYDCFT